MDDVIICSECGQDIPVGSKFLAIFKINEGFFLLTGCEHNLSMIYHMCMKREKDLIGFAGSMDCLSKIIWEHVKKSCEHGEKTNEMPNM